MGNKLLVLAGLLSGALLGTSGGGYAQSALLQNAAFSDAEATVAPQLVRDAVKNRVHFGVPGTGTMIHVDQRDAPAGYVNTRPYALATPAEDTAAPGADQIATDWRIVTGARVNLRAGPGTGNPVVGRLTRGTRAKVLAQLDNGWVQLQIPDQGLAGFMSAKFLATQN